MTTIEMDMEKLERMTSVRVEVVQHHIDNGWSTDWELVEEMVQRELKLLSYEREMEPYRAAGEAMRRFSDALIGMARAFQEGFNGDR